MKLPRAFRRPKEGEMWCPACNGSGKGPYSQPHGKHLPCRVCRGRGVVKIRGSR